MANNVKIEIGKRTRVTKNNGYERQFEEYTFNWFEDEEQIASVRIGTCYKGATSKLDLIMRDPKKVEFYREFYTYTDRETGEVREGYRIIVTNGRFSVHVVNYSQNDDDIFQEIKALIPERKVPSEGVPKAEKKA